MVSIEERISASFDGEFMQPVATDEEFIKYEVGNEMFLAPASVEGTLPNDAHVRERYIGAWFCRLSAAGYMDCTDWIGPFDSEIEAMEELLEQFGN